MESLRIIRAEVQNFKRIEVVEITPEGGAVEITIAAEKAATLEAAEMPVEGLAVTDDGVTFEGLPLDQAAQSRRIRVCTAIGAALNPRLNIALIRHGNDIDPEHLREFYATCAEHGIQPWVERRSGVTGNALVIEAGRVKGAEKAED